MCLDVVESKRFSGANVEQQACVDGQHSQQRKLVQVDNGYFTVVNRNSGECLDVDRAGMRDGSK